jgi:ERCC4-type nuclease
MTTTFLIDPTERPPISTLGRTSEMVQGLGCDIIWETPKGIAGVQRKTISDLISSVRSPHAHLGDQFQKMMKAGLSHAFLVIEGVFQWSAEGELLGERTRWTQREQWGIELSAQRQGIMVAHTRTPMETVACCEYLSGWTQKGEHVSSLLVRQGPQKNGWGRLDNREYGIHVLSGYAGVGQEIAGRIFDHYGHVPCRHDVVEKALTEVPGIGKKRAEQIARVLG